MVDSCKLFNNFKPVYDGKKNLYTKEALPFGQERVELDVVMPGDSAVDRKFRVALKVFYFILIDFFLLLHGFVKVSFMGMFLRDMFTVILQFS